MRTKLPDFKMLLGQYPIPILAISEAYVTDGFRIRGYKTFKSGDADVSWTTLCIRRDLTVAL